MRRFLVALIVLINLAVTTNSFADASFVKRHDVQTFIKSMVKKHGFSKSYLVSLFSSVKIRPQIMRHINKPLEKETWDTYQTLFISPSRIEHGVEFWNKYATVLRKAEQTYGVPASIIVATMGIETKYGHSKGNFRVIDSLSNIAFSHSPRAPFFRKELEQFLLLSREEHINPTKIMGSYAGAIGQPQFMPSSYRYYAVNFSKSGQTDLMNNVVDVIGSIANYYNKHGWTTDAPVATPAHLTSNQYRYLLKTDKSKDYMSLATLSDYGVVPKFKMQASDLKARIIELQRRDGQEYWLGFHNFYVIKRYNASDLYAMAVYQLSHRIKEMREQTKNG